MEPPIRTNLQPTDVLLWLAFQHGDAGALGKLVGRHYNALLQYARKFSRDEELIADCIQNVLLRIWDTRQRLSVPTNVKYYLLGSVRHAVIEAVKKDRLIEHEYEWETWTGETEDVEADWIERETNETDLGQLRQRFDKLSPRQREALYLRYYEELSYAEIGQLMGINPQSVANTLQIAIQNLRKNWLWSVLLIVVTGLSRVCLE